MRKIYQNTSFLGPVFSRIRTIIRGNTGQRKHVFRHILRSDISNISGLLFHRTPMMFCKKGVLKNFFQNSQENTCAKVSFLIKLQALTFFIEHLQYLVLVCEQMLLKNECGKETVTRMCSTN